MMVSFTLAIALAATVQVAPAATGLEVFARTTDSNGRTKVTTLFSMVGDLRSRQDIRVRAQERLRWDRRVGDRTAASRVWVAQCSWDRSPMHRSQRRRCVPTSC